MARKLTEARQCMPSSISPPDQITFRGRIFPPRSESCRNQRDRSERFARVRRISPAGAWALSRCAGRNVIHRRRRSRRGPGSPFCRRRSSNTGVFISRHGAHSAGINSFAGREELPAPTVEHRPRNCRVSGLRRRREI